jgi:hypothetical protein
VNWITDCACMQTTLNLSASLGKPEFMKVVHTSNFRPATGTRTVQPHPPFTR